MGFKLKLQHTILHVIKSVLNEDFLFCVRYYYKIKIDIEDDDNIEFD